MEVTTKEKLYVYLRYYKDCDAVTNYICNAKAYSNKELESMFKRYKFEWSDYISYEDLKKEFGFFKNEVIERVKELKEMGFYDVCGK